MSCQNLNRLCPIGMLLTILLLGCAKTGPTHEDNVWASKNESYSPLKEVHPSKLERKPILLIARSLPIYYVVQSTGSIRITDSTSKTILVTTTATSQQSLTLESDTGIRLGTESLIPSPLPPDHRYEIWWEPTIPNSRTESFEQSHKHTP